MSAQSLSSRALFFCGVLPVASLLLGCSLEAPRPPGGVRIILEDAQSSKSSALALLENMTFSLSGPSTMATNPTSTSDFNCFAVNVTGAGVPSQSDRLQGCTSANNMRGVGVGLLSKLVVRGAPIELDIPSGKNRTIDVYGVYPPQSECGGGNSGGGGDGGGGYFMGRVQRDIAADTTVTVPVSFGGGAPDVVCTGGGGGGFYVGLIFPYGGRSSGGWTTHIHGNGFISTSIVTIGSTPCASQTVVNGQTIDCVVPSGLTSGTNYYVTVNNQNGQTATTSGSYFYIASAGPYVSTDTNTNDTNFGSVAVGSTKDITFTFSSNGTTSASEVASPSLSAPFSLVGGTCSFPSTLAVDTTCTVTVRFSPSSTGPATNSSIAFFSAGGPTITFNGTGI